jgi:quercetin dioxygenase-like cupin family protein
VGIAREGPWEPMVGDPDDHRPATTWRLTVDPGNPGGSLAAFAVLEERCAVGDRIPLHRHDVDELVIIREGRARYDLAGEQHSAGPGDTVFIPAGTVHGTGNAGDVALHLYAVFPATRVRIEMIERNAAPGTEDRLPMSTVYDFRTGETTIEGPTRTTRST